MQDKKNRGGGRRRVGRQKTKDTQFVVSNLTWFAPVNFVEFLTLNRPHFLSYFKLLFRNSATDTFPWTKERATKYDQRTSNFI